MVQKVQINDYDVYNDVLLRESFLYDRWASHRQLDTVADTLAIQILLLF